MTSETWRVVLADGSVREVTVRGSDLFSSPPAIWYDATFPDRDASFGSRSGVATDPRCAVMRAVTDMREDSHGGGLAEILAPGELTRAEALAAVERKLASATAAGEALACDLRRVSDMAQRAAETHADAVTAERERCARVCDEVAPRHEDHSRRVREHASFSGVAWGEGFDDGGESVRGEDPRGRCVMDADEADARRLAAAIFATDDVGVEVRFASGGSVAHAWIATAFTPDGDVLASTDSRSTGGPTVGGALRALATQLRRHAEELRARCETLASQRETAAAAYRDQAARITDALSVGRRDEAGGV